MPEAANPSRRAVLAATAALAGLALAPASVLAQARPPKRVLFVVSNPAKAAANGMEIGYWLPELAHPYWAFAQRGYALTIASPKGGVVAHDQMSDPDGGRFGNPKDFVSLGFKHAPDVAKALAQTVPLREAKFEDHDAIFVVGGFAPPTTFPGEPLLHELFARFHASGKPTAAICHGTCVLLYAKGADGKPLAAGRRWTGYTNAEEDVVDRVFGMKFQPFRIEDEAAKIAGSNFMQGAPYRPHAVADGNLITGQQGSSGLATAELVVAALEKS